jgi:hypothetical protein
LNWQRALPLAPGKAAERVTFGIPKRHRSLSPHRSNGHIRGQLRR